MSATKKVITKATVTTPYHHMDVFTVPEEMDGAPKLMIQISGFKSISGKLLKCVLLQPKETSVAITG